MPTAAGRSGGSRRPLRRLQSILEEDYDRGERATVGGAVITCRRVHSVALADRPGRRRRPARRAAAATAAARVVTSDAATEGIYVEVGAAHLPGADLALAQPGRHRGLASTSAACRPAPSSTGKGECGSASSCASKNYSDDAGACTAVGLQDRRHRGRPVTRRSQLDSQPQPLRLHAGQADAGRVVPEPADHRGHQSPIAGRAAAVPASPSSAAQNRPLCCTSTTPASRRRSRSTSDGR